MTTATPQNTLFPLIPVDFPDPDPADLLDDLLLFIANADYNASVIWTDPQPEATPAAAFSKTATKNQLELDGFLPDPGAPDFYTHSKQPCPSCDDSNTHKLFAVWNDFPAPRFWCQKQATSVEYQLPNSAPDREQHR